LAYTWFLNCKHGQYHDVQSCHFKPKPAWLPTRLVDIGRSWDKNWKLIESESIIKESIPAPDYLTLSYRWGGDEEYRLTSSTLVDFRRGQPKEDLPLTFRDLIKVARRFGIRYLWIDRLCIMQDSASDWQHEARLMSDVYANAACNIAAAAAADPNGGLFRAREISKSLPGRIKVHFKEERGATELIIENTSMYSTTLQLSPIHRRGWIVQEIYLARRVIYYTQDHILWSCRCLQTREGQIEFHGSQQLSLPSSTPRFGDVRSNPDLQAIVSTRWYEEYSPIVRQYSESRLTKSEDRQIAFEGIGRAFKESLKDGYVAGHLLSELITQLSWYTETPEPAPLSITRAPTWSWAAIDSPVLTHRWDCVGNKPPLVKLEDLIVMSHPSSGNEESPSPAIKLRGPVIKCHCRTTAGGSLTFTQFSPKAPYTKEGKHPFHARALPDLRETNFAGGMDLHLLLHRHFLPIHEDGPAAKRSQSAPLNCMILQLVPELDHSRNVFRRLGWLIVEEEGLGHAVIQWLLSEANECDQQIILV
jgi:hypothetical protein